MVIPRIDDLCHEVHHNYCLQSEAPNTNEGRVQELSPPPGCAEGMRMMTITMLVRSISSYHPALPHQAEKCRGGGLRERREEGTDRPGDYLHTVRNHVRRYDTQVSIPDIPINRFPPWTRFGPAFAETCISQAVDLRSTPFQVPRARLHGVSDHILAGFGAGSDAADVLMGQSQQHRTAEIPWCTHTKLRST